LNKNTNLKVGELIMKSIAKFFVSVKKEMKKVRWLKKKELAKYSIATISFIVIFMGFFALSDAILSAIRMVIK
jgi:preprotein translocase SecE subunit